MKIIMLVLALFALPTLANEKAPSIHIEDKGFIWQCYPQDCKDYVSPDQPEDKEDVPAIKPMG